MAGSDSQPNSSCARWSAASSAALLRSAGYLAMACWSPASNRCCCSASNGLSTGPALVPRGIIAARTCTARGAVCQGAKPAARGTWPALAADAIVGGIGVPLAPARCRSKAWHPVKPQPSVTSGSLLVIDFALVAYRQHRHLVVDFVVVVESEVAGLAAGDHQLAQTRFHGTADQRVLVEHADGTLDQLRRARSRLLQPLEVGEGTRGVVHRILTGSGGAGFFPALFALK